jgi:hypothetical protein
VTALATVGEVREAVLEEVEVLSGMVVVAWVG